MNVQIRWQMFSSHLLIRKSNDKSWGKSKSYVFLSIYGDLFFNLLVFKTCTLYYEFF